MGGGVTGGGVTGEGVTGSRGGGRGGGVLVGGVTCWFNLGDEVILSLSGVERLSVSVPSMESGASPE